MSQVVAFSGPSSHDEGPVRISSAGPSPTAREKEEMTTKVRWSLARSCLLLVPAFLGAGLCSCAPPDDASGGLTEAKSAIQGGAVETGFPAVGIVFNSNGYGSGTLITRTTVLTAAHAINGTMDFKTGTNGTNEIDRPVAYSIIDPTGADLALMKLRTPVTDVVPFTNIAAGPPPVGMICTAVGFGIHNNPDGTWTAGVKRSDTETVVSSTTHDIVTEFLTGIADSGDSGGPLFCGGIAGVVHGHEDGVWPAHQRERYATVRTGWIKARAQTAGDVDFDAFSDIVLTGGSLTTIPVALSNGDFAGTFRTTNYVFPTFQSLAAQSGVKVVPGDFDGDGRWDLALTGGSAWSSIPIAFSNGDGTFGSRTLRSPASPPGRRRAASRPWPATSTATV
jgi:hypothetical protein